MPVFILKNGFEDAVVQDLTSLLGNIIAVDASGRVSITAAVSGTEIEILRDLTEGSAYIGIRGEASGFPLFPANGTFLRDRGGVTIRTSPVPAASVEVVYDVEMADGRGYHVFDEQGNEIAQLRYLILWHELAHAYMQSAGAIPAMGEDEMAVTMENSVRHARNLPARFGHAGGIGKPAPPKKPSTGTQPNGGGCFVASAAFGSPLHPQVVKLRAFRDDTLRQTRLGRDWWERFFSHYEKFSPDIVELMARDPEVLTLVRNGIVTPLVQYLELFTSFPDIPVEQAGPVWAEWLTLARDRFEEFALGATDLPTDFTGLAAADAVAELEVVLRFGLRTTERRLTWLARLIGEGELPLRVSAHERPPLAAQLAAGGRSDAEIALVLGPAKGVAEEGDCGCSHPVVSGSMYGDDTLVASGAGIDVDPKQWYYTVTIRNATADTFDVIQAFYKTKTVPDGVVSANAYGVRPGQTVVLNMGICADLISYTVAFVLRDNVVWTIPDPTFLPDGTLVTPAVAVTWQAGLARDAQRCEDSYVLEP